MYSGMIHTYCMLTCTYVRMYVCMYVGMHVYLYIMWLVTKVDATTSI